MIINFLVQILGGLVTGLFSIIPSWSIDDSSMHSMDNTAASFGSLNNWVPEQLVISLVILLVAVKLFMLAWHGVLFLYRLIPFNG